MITHEMLDYIRDELQSGADKMEIADNLLNAGWLQGDIDEAFLNIDRTAMMSEFGGAPEPPEPPIDAHAAPVIALENLTKYYGKTKGIEDLNLSVNKGEIFGFLGPNGAGKTTTIKTILNLLHPTSGNAYILGLDSQRDYVRTNMSIGYLPGDVKLYPKYTGNQLVRFASAVYGKQYSLNFVRSVIRRLQCNMKMPFKKLSKGNKQKIGILLSIALVSMNSAREKARDGRRYADFYQIRSAMLLCFDDENCGDKAGEYLTTGISVSNIDSDFVPCYLCPTPKDPSGADYDWIGNSGNEDKYCVYRQMEASGKWIAASHKGACFSLNSDPTTLSLPLTPLDCWNICP